MYAAALDSTIIAISSAPGRGARGIVRLTGPEALRIADGFYAPNNGKSLTECAGHTVCSGAVVFDELRRVAADAWVFRAPRSYTRQDLVELHLPGSPPLLEMVVELAVAAGARVAEPGEFTARAFLSGRLNLAAAEGVAGVIQAQNDAELRAAQRMLQGGLGQRLAEWQDELADLLARVVAEIDFSEEPIDFIAPDELASQVRTLADRLDALIGRAQAERQADVAARILLLGPPNAGKSTLLNRLAGSVRAIESDVAGTTRDVLAVRMQWHDREVLLLDAAGIDDSEDALIVQGRANALRTAGEVDAVLLVVDASKPDAKQSLQRLAENVTVPRVVIGNKVDLLAEAGVADVASALAVAGAAPVVLASARTGVGVEELVAAALGVLDHQPVAVEDAGLAVNARQAHALVAARDALHRCAALCLESESMLDCAELVAVDLRDAVDAIGAISGAVTTEDLLGRIFGSFCIGK